LEARNPERRNNALPLSGFLVSEFISFVGQNKKAIRGKRMAKNSSLPTAALPASGLRGRPKTFGPLSHGLPRSVVSE
jgi:hypothetical protein